MLMASMDPVKDALSDLKTNTSTIIHGKKDTSLVEKVKKRKTDDTTKVKNVVKKSESKSSETSKLEMAEKVKTGGTSKRVEKSSETSKSEKVEKKMASKSEKVENPKLNALPKLNVEKPKLTPKEEGATSKSEKGKLHESKLENTEQKTSKRKWGDDSDSEEDTGSDLEDFIVKDESDESDEGDKSDNESEESNTDDEKHDESEEEYSIKDDLYLDVSNIVSGKRKRTQTKRYETEVFQTKEYQKLMFCDIPQEELQAAICDEDFTDDDESAEDPYEDNNDDDDDDDDDDEYCNDDDEYENVVPPLSPPLTPSLVAGIKKG